jgi:ATP-dependent Clp protease, protease subunit
MSDLAERKIAYLGYCGIIDDAGVTRIIQALNLAINGQFDAVYLCFTSAGGYVGSGIYLYNHVRGLPIDICLHNTGTCASIAATAFTAGKTRRASSNATFMMHPISVGAQIGQLSSAPLVSYLQGALADEDRTERILRDRTRMPELMLQARRNGELHITAQQALEVGLIDEVVEFSLPPGNQIFQI